jgi:hypothetical protein
LDNLWVPIFQHFPIISNIIYKLSQLLWMYIVLVEVHTLHSRHNDSESAHSLSALIFSFAGSSLFCFIYLSLWVVITITMIILGTMFCLKRITFIPHSYDNRCYVIVFYFLYDTELHYYVFSFIHRIIRVKPCVCSVQLQIL